MRWPRRAAFARCPAITMSAMPDTPANRSPTSGWLAGGPISARTGGSRMSRAIRLVGLDAHAARQRRPRRSGPGSLARGGHGRVRGGRQIAWFLHRPLFLDSPDEARHRILVDEAAAARSAHRAGAAAFGDPGRQRSSAQGASDGARRHPLRLGPASALSGRPGDPAADAGRKAARRRPVRARRQRRSKPRSSMSRGSRNIGSTMSSTRSIRARLRSHLGAAVVGCPLRPSWGERRRAGVWVSEGRVD